MKKLAILFLFLIMMSCKSKSKETVPLHPDVFSFCKCQIHYYVETYKPVVVCKCPFDPKGQTLFHCE
jgi:hypothetical protein